MRENAWVILLPGREESSDSIFGGEGGMRSDEWLYRVDPVFPVGRALREGRCREVLPFQLRRKWGYKPS